MTKAIAVASDPIQLFCSVFHICFFMLKCQGGGVWWGTECACLWLNVVETPPPLTDGWLLPVCITYPALILLPMKRKFKSKKRRCWFASISLLAILILPAISERRCYQMEENIQLLISKVFLSFPASSKPTLVTNWVAGQISDCEKYRSTPLDYIWRAQICAKKCIFGIFERAKYGQVGCPWEDLAKCSSYTFGLRSIGPSSQKLWPNQIFGWSPHCN